MARQDAGTIGRAASMAADDDVGLRRYLIFVLVALLVPVFAVAAINLAVDPLLYRWPRASWQPVPAYLPFDREVHYNLVAQTHPRLMLLGNSQTQHGFDPRHWGMTGASIANAGIVGADLSEITRTLRIAQHGGHVSQALLGIDFTMARGRTGVPPSTQEPFVLAPSGALRAANLRGLFSFTLLRSSVNALLNRYRRHIAFFGPQGQALDLLYVQSAAEHGGTIGALAGRLAQYEQTLREPPIDFASQLRVLRDQACLRRTRLMVFLTPLHATWIDALEDVGAAGDWAAWKRTVAAISEERPGCRFDVWDFNTFSPITTEALPQPGLTGRLSASWDGVHFKPWVGDRILARLRAGTDAPDGFGIRLTPATVEAALSRDRHAGDIYHATHPDMPSPQDILATLATPKS